MDAAIEDALAENEQSAMFVLGKDLGETVTEIAETLAWAWPRRSRKPRSALLARSIG